MLALHWLSWIGGADYIFWLYQPEKVCKIQARAALHNMAQMNGVLFPPQHLRPDDHHKPGIPQEPAQTVTHVLV